MLGYKVEKTNDWKTEALTVDHTPGLPKERTRIEKAGGSIISSSTTSSVRYRSVVLDESEKPIIKDAACLHLSKSLGHFRSFIEGTNEYIVSPQPDVQCFKMYPKRCCVLFWQLKEYGAQCRLHQQSPWPRNIKKSLRVTVVLTVNQIPQSLFASVLSKCIN